MNYLHVRPSTKLSKEEILGLFDKEPEPVTERRPDLTKAWAERMNGAIEFVGSNENVIEGH